MTAKEKISNTHHEQFQVQPQVVAQAPGRINIIGEHTDYNDGFVLPAAIDQHTTVSISRRSDQQIKLYSVLFDEVFSIAIQDLKPQADSWVNYPLGVFAQMKERGYAVEGFSMVVDGNVPLGAGVSSSASVECATALALNELFTLEISKRELTEIAQKAEHTYAGVKCGIMDQFASVFGKENHVVRLDCRSFEYEYFPLELGDYALLLLNTNVKHSLASSAYNDRRAACEQTVALLQQDYPEVQSLRDVTEEMLNEKIKNQHPRMYPKVLYVVKEIQRVIDACQALEQNDLDSVGQLMYQTHEGLSKNYEVSCDELDFLVDFVKAYPQVLGARVMGGGFGGCTLNLIEKSFVEELIEKVTPQYEQKFNLPLTPIRVAPSVGAHIL